MSRGPEAIRTMGGIMTSDPEMIARYFGLDSLEDLDLVRPTITPTKIHKSDSAAQVLLDGGGV